MKRMVLVVLLLQSVSLASAVGLVPQIIDKVEVLNTGLTQDDVVDGVIELSEVGSYIPKTNLVADVLITGTNVTLNLDGRSIAGTIDISGSIVVVKNGAVIAPTPLNDTQAAQPAVTVQSGCKSVLLKHFHVDCYDSVLTGTLFDLVATDTTLTEYELVGTATVFESMPGRTAIELDGTIVSLFDCSISSGSSADTTEADAQNAGDAIVLQSSADKVRVLDCIMITGHGGDATSGAGGDGGCGIRVQDGASHAEISKCTIFETGHGGDGSTTGGNGGDGISIESGADDVEVHHCRIRNSGLAGSPNGQAGKAIVDGVTTSGAYSMVFSNFAHNIANDITFDLRGTGTEQGVASPNPPDDTVVNPYANVYVS